MNEELADRLAAVRTRIEAACRAAGRPADAATLVAVCKTVPAERCREAIAAGQVVLGENYAQELRDKAPAVPGARWHFIGPLQRNKVKYVVGVAELIHSIDGTALLDEVARRAGQLGLRQRVLLQVNVAEEPQKSGCPPAALAALVEACAARPELALEGLMCIPPAAGDPRPHFERLRALAAQHRLPTLSMGMSADFETAIAAGATLVRVGSALFGARPQVD